MLPVIEGMKVVVPVVVVVERRGVGLEFKGEERGVDQRRVPEVRERPWRVPSTSIRNRGGGLT